MPHTPAHVQTHAYTCTHICTHPHTPSWATNAAHRPSRLMGSRGQWCHLHGAQHLRGGRSFPPETRHGGDWTGAAALGSRPRPPRALLGQSVASLGSGVLGSVWWELRGPVVWVGRGAQDSPRHQVGLAPNVSGAGPRTPVRQLRGSVEWKMQDVERSGAQARTGDTWPVAQERPARPAGHHAENPREPPQPRTGAVHPPSLLEALSPGEEGRRSPSYPPAAPAPAPPPCPAPRQHQPPPPLTPTPAPTASPTLLRKTTLLPV